MEDRVIGSYGLQAIDVRGRQVVLSNLLERPLQLGLEAGAFVGVEA